MSSFKNVKLHLVGEGSAIAYLKKLVTEKGLERQVMFHGFKTGEELDEMFNKCHVAVGSLGLHRLGFRESSVLKDKEYCARGIPFIYSLPDADFPGKSRYRFKVPADDTPLDMTAIMAFCRGILKNKNHTMEMREFAFHNLDWKHKMKKLKLYLQTLT